MKTIRFILLASLAAVLVIAGVVFAAERSFPKNLLIKEPNTWRLAEDRAISMYLEENRDKLARITEEPQLIHDSTGSLCDPPFDVPHEPHSGFWIHVFINPEAAETIKTGKGTYAEGTIILKQKFLDEAATQTEFYTGMRKREKDYNPKFGDWEFFTLDPTGTKVTARGKIDSCIDCHANYEKTDFVTRKYLTRPSLKSAE